MIRPLPLLFALLLPVAAWGQVQITWSKSFPGSTPAYAEVVVSPDGSAAYREDPKDENPVKFQFSESDWTQITNLAQKLDNFSRPLESGLKLANMGMKTLHYEGPGGTHEAKFNYSEDPEAKALNDIFEQTLETERAFIELERCVRFDKLGTQAALLRIEVLRDRKMLIAASQFLPLLDRVQKNESFMHMARDRAAALAEQFRKPK